MKPHQKDNVPPAEIAIVENPTIAALSEITLHPAEVVETLPEVDSAEDSTDITDEKDDLIAQAKALASTPTAHGAYPS